MSVLTPGDVIDGRYLVCDLLGRGGMAEVFRATDTATDRGVAVKILRSAEPGGADRFRFEADALARLDHPGLVRLHGTGCHAGAPYLVLDLADGPTLAWELADGPIGLDRTLTLGAAVAEALAHAHLAGVVHRDVKPANILFDRCGRALLADFGIARLPGSPSVTGTGQVVGSARYMAPEQVMGEPTGPPADIYALGLVLIECLTGRACYPGGQAEAALVRLSCRPDIPSDLPPWLRDVLAVMTAREPARRPPADAVAAALTAGSAEPVLAVTAASPVAGDVRGDTDAAPGAVGALPRWDAQAPVRRRTALAAAAASAVLAGLAGTLLTWGVANDDRSAGDAEPVAAATSTTVESSAAPLSGVGPPTTTAAPPAAPTTSPASPPSAVGGPPPPPATAGSTPATAGSTPATGAPATPGDSANGQGRGPAGAGGDASGGAEDSGNPGNGRP